MNASVYYTAVESYHTRQGSKKSVRGYLGYYGDTSGFSKVDLGKFNSDFVSKVYNEGTGRLVTPRFFGTRGYNFLNYSQGVGYWLDVIPCDSYGNSLLAFVTAAADGDVMARGTRFKITDCGVDSESGELMDPVACATFKAANWEIQDEFSAGKGGSGHIDLYVGFEHTANFESRSPYWVDQIDVQVNKWR